MLLGQPREGEGRAPRSSRKIFLLLAVVAVIGWFYILLQSELFEIQAVVIEGNRMNDPLEIEREVYRWLDERPNWRPWQSRHGRFLNEEALRQDLKKTFYLDQVDVQKKSFNILRLKVKEYPHRLIVYKNQDFYWVDLRGHLDTSLTKDERQQALTRAYGKRSANTDEPPLVRLESLGVNTSTTFVLTPERLKSLISFTLDLQHLQLPYQELRLDTATSSKLTVMNGNAIPVYFDFSNDALVKRQLHTYEAFMATEKSKKSKNQYQYIDVQVPDMIYVR